MITPCCVKPTATLKNCTSEGLTYHDKLNDFTLLVQAGAIPSGKLLTIDIGVALYGPFQYPEGVRPVSPVFWICVRGQKNYTFLKPVHVTIEHCIQLDSNEEIASLGLKFLKGSHDLNSQQRYSFSTVDRGSTFKFKAKCSYGTLKTDHFCYLCIVGELNESTIKKAKFCLFGTIPRSFVYNESMYIYFFVTFLLKTCLETVRKQIMTIPQLAICKYFEAKKEFQFLSECFEPEIMIHIPKSLTGGWQIGLEMQNKVCCNVECCVITCKNDSYKKW